MNTNDLIQKAKDGEPLLKKDLVQLLDCPSDSPQAYQMMAQANRISKDLTDNKAEIHAQLALNLAPCPCNCAFCSFAQINGLFKEEIRLTPGEAVEYATQFEKDGANAVFIMTTAIYPFSLFIEISKEIRQHLKPDTLMIANVGDQSLDRAKQLRDVGYSGVYHALRLREGQDTNLSPDDRLKSIRNFQEAGLKVGTCVEPIGPEHSNEEIAEAILFTGAFNPSYSGAARRIAIPGTKIAERGMISELRMAHIVAVTRLGVPGSVAGNCTHEPCTLGGIAGANLFWAEAGANPRDIEKKTEDGRGETVQSCRQIFHECGWEVREGVSRFYSE